MNVGLVEIERKQNELFFNIIDKDTNVVIGILFTIGNHVAYEVKPEFRGQGVATEALKLITSQIDGPVLEITFDNIASQKVALKAGYILVRSQFPLGFYEYSKEKGRSK